MHHLHIPRLLKEVGRIFHSKGYEAFLVGGALRNRLAGFPETDFDLATNARPEAVLEMFRRVIPTGIKHGTVTVFYKGEKIEVTTFRTESDYSDARHPDSIVYIGDILGDLKRRDFTINSLALNLATGELLDPHEGRRDIKGQTIRAIGNPSERFSEDGLRLMRACRFACELDFTIEEATLRGMCESADRIDRVSPERIQDELVKILASPKPSTALLLMDETGLLARLLPELTEGKGVEQKGMHEFDVFKHSIL
ncbi:MAG TPA: CCA tRNA nucleotidyltransferase, partial [Spirochaetia bacterium]|nr:CCA tRNA nucleotidyltransferase [Spirochaetia bacterium]